LRNNKKQRKIQLLKQLNIGGYVDKATGYFTAKQELAASICHFTHHGSYRLYA